VSILKILNCTFDILIFLVTFLDNDYILKLLVIGSPIPKMMNGDSILEYWIDLVFSAI
jgi:hypothetical protein